MKLRNPTTGEVVSIKDAVYIFCSDTWCDSCPIRTESGDFRCQSWAESHPVVVARLMDYEVVEDDKVAENDQVKKETNMDNDQFPESGKMMEQPRICEILGVVPGEEFFIKGFYPGHVTFRIMDDGTFSTRPSNISGSTKKLLQTLDHPDRIIRKPRFTQQEVEDAKTLLRIFPEQLDSVSRADDGTLTLKAKGAWRCHLNSDAFPSLKPGETITIDEIIGGAE